MIKRIPLDSLPAGNPVTQNIYDENNRLLLKQGMTLSPEFIEKLKSNNIDEVYIKIQLPNTPSQETIKDKRIYVPTHLFQKYYDNILYELERIKLRGYYFKPIQKEILSISADFTNLLLKDTEAALDFFFQLKRANSNYSYIHHHANTYILAALISNWLNLEQTTIKEISVVALLHDIGETRIPQHILRKSERLTEEEKKIIRTHPTIGLQILSKTDWINNRELYGILTHHERLNGQGYPNGILGSKIPIHSRIVSVASILNVATTNRAHAKAKNILKILLELRDRSYGELDSKVTRVLYNKVSECLLKNNKVIYLENGDRGYLKQEDNKVKILIQGEKDLYNLDDYTCPKIINIL